MRGTSNPNIRRDIERFLADWNESIAAEKHFWFRNELESLIDSAWDEGHIAGRNSLADDLTNFLEENTDTP